MKVVQSNIEEIQGTEKRNCVSDNSIYHEELNKENIILVG